MSESTAPPHPVVMTHEGAAAQEDPSQEDPSQEDPSPRHKAPTKLPAGSHRAESTQQNYKTAAKYIDKWLAENDHVTFEELTYEHVEADHLQNFVENIMFWLAVTPFKTNTGWLTTDVKVRAANKEAWWNEQKKDFKKSCKRSRIADPSVEEMRKSAPLYRDVSKARTLSTTIRAKYLNHKADAKGVAMGMLKEASCYSIQKLFEFALCWQAIGRGGEHVFLRWTEMRWDDLFQAPDFDWSMSKQSEKKCTLLFCDRFLYCLCPMFTMGLFMLFDGLRRDVEATKGAVKNYVFPLMHKTRKDGVAEALTKAVKKYIGNDFGVEFAKFYSIRSVRKGGMTHNRSNRNLSTQEEYARSGHMAPGMNGNAEGYIDSTPALSAPGGMSLAGYTDPHGEH
eukprot:scaffold5246_cov75-Cyclotella_meneghiniana.AAC.1